MNRILKFPNAIYKLVKPGKKLAPNEVLFHVPLWHNKIQIKNYLEEIYNVEVQRVDTSILQGKRKLIRTGRSRTPFADKEPDIKKAYVTLKNQTFEFPDLE
jgi:ribosomal protein L23